MPSEEATIDDVRAYWDSRPCNIRHSDEPVGTPAYFDEVSARKYLVEPHITRFADFSSWRGKRVLDVGCGIGTMTQSFAEAGAQVTGVDLSPESLAVAEKRIRALGLEDRVELYEANAEKLSEIIPADEYDLIFSFGVLHHTPSPKNAFAELRNFSKPGTQLKVMVYHRFSTKVAALALRYGFPQPWKVDEAVAKQSEAQFGCPVTFTYSRNSGRRLIEDAGFEVDNVAVDHIFPYQIAEYRQHRYVKRPYWRALPDSAFEALEKKFGWHLLIDAHAPA